MDNPRIPRIRVPKKGVIPPPAINLAREKYEEAGVLVLDGILPASYIDQLREAFLADYEKTVREKNLRFKSDVGDKRIMLSVDVEGLFNQQRLYANRHAYPVIARLLGNEMIINAFNAVTSLPGSKIQHLHADHPELFWDAKLDDVMPPFCVSMAIPLVDLNAETGGTRYYPGSQKRTDDTSPKTPYFDPEVPKGSAILFDSRVRHRGLANKSDGPRPVLYMIYARPWFRDYVNYDFDEALRITRKEFNKVRPKYQHLFDWLMVKGRKPKKK
ncbi:MAG: hypothetical protein GKS01_01755 [Alphaproteobacteria bacterium]|nr:hypothetical protein [Alphaproteobacteria bacterium]